MKRLDRLRQRLDTLSRCDPDRQVFGAATHGYALGAPADETAVRGFESAFAVTLPAAYRDFLLLVGDGGAGPYYGLSKLAPLVRRELPRHDVVLTGEDGQVLARAGTPPRAAPDVASSPARPFPLDSAWAPRDGALPIPAGTSPYDGAVHLAEIGCGYFAFLIVNGRRAGEVWADYTAGDGAIRKEHHDFLGWYESWLDGAFVEWAALYLPRVIALGTPLPEAMLEELVPALERDVAAAPDFYLAQRRLGYLRLAQGRHDDAIAAFEACARTSKDEPIARLHLDTARARRLQGRPEDALAHVAAGLAQPGVWYPTRIDLRREQYLSLGLAGRRAEVAECLEALVALGPPEIDPYLALARQHLEAGLVDATLRALEQAIAKGAGCRPGAAPTDRRAAVHAAFFALLEQDGRADLAETLWRALPAEPAGGGSAKPGGGWKKS